MFVIILKALFILVCVFLILVILLQSGKGGDVAAAFGGSGSQTAFGPRGAQKPLEKATIVSALIFMLLALLFSLPGFGTNSVIREGGGTPVPTPGAASTAPSPAATASPEASPAASPVASGSPGASPKTDSSKAPDAKAKASPSPASPKK